ncbi:MAG: hypothetical protein V3T16_02495, partial [Gemmatimonadales bacterium]
MSKLLAFVGAFVGGWLGWWLGAPEEVDQKGVDFFETRIRPMLVEHCYRCHSAAAARKGKLKG